MITVVSPFTKFSQIAKEKPGKILGKILIRA
jgi:hypothetical protein